MKSVLVFIWLCCMIPSIIVAQPVTEAETLATQAKEHFKARDYEVAANMYMAAYAKAHTPALIYNAARAYEEAGKKAEAIALFRMYITLSKDEAGIADAKAHIAKLEEQPKVVDATPEKPAVVVHPEVPKPLVATPKRSPEPNRTGAWLTTGGSIALVGIGFGMMLDGASGTQRYSGINRASYDASQREWWSGMALISVGAALGGVSAYLWTRPVTVVPTHKGVALGVAF